VRSLAAVGGENGDILLIDGKILLIDGKVECPHFPFLVILARPNKVAVIVLTQLDFTGNGVTYI
jgi:hypothetical protein